MIQTPYDPKTQPPRINELIAQVINIINDIIGSEKSYDLYLFGSRVDQNIEDGSDIDLAISCSELREQEFRKIKHEVDLLRTLYKIDFIDLKLVDLEFRDIVLKKAIKINE